jgi:hypothetical protein
MRKTAYDNSFATDSQIIINYILISLRKIITDIFNLSNLSDHNYFNIINL